MHLIEGIITEIQWAAIPIAHAPEPTASLYQKNLMHPDLTQRNPIYPVLRQASTCIHSIDITDYICQSVPLENIRPLAEPTRQVSELPGITVEVVSSEYSTIESQVQTTRTRNFLTMKVSRTRTATA